MLSAARQASFRTTTRHLRPTSLPVRPSPSSTSRQLSSLSPPTRAGGLLRTESVLRLQRNPNRYAQVFKLHSTAIRPISFGTFGRAVPKLFGKVFVLFRLPAAFGASMVAGVAYVNHQLQSE